MQAISDMRKRFHSERRLAPFQDRPKFSGEGLILGYRTVLVSGQTIKYRHETDDGERISALLSAAYGCQIASSVPQYLGRALHRWRDGDEALAYIELAFARLPRLEPDDQAFRLFLAEALAC